MYAAIETYRGFVYPSAIDHIGHMTVQSYTARFDEATWQFLAQLGLYFDIEQRAPTPLPASVHRRATEWRTTRRASVAISAGDTEEMIAVT